MRECYAPYGRDPDSREAQRRRRQWAKQMARDAAVYGVSFMQGARRIDPRTVYAEAPNVDPGTDAELAAGLLKLTGDQFHYTERYSGCVGAPVTLKAMREQMGKAEGPFTNG
jgi:hypothetical protein